MLKKLFSHEWKACWRLMAAVNGIVLVITLLGMIVFRNDFWKDMEESSPILGISLILYFLVYMVSIGALSFVVSLYFYVRFFNNLYTDQGYLMHTLPVTPAQLIWSKAFVGVIWQFISAIVIVFSICSFVFSMVSGDDGIDRMIWNELCKELTGQDGWQIIAALLMTLIAAVASSFMTIFLGYTAISIGQLCKKQKILGAVGAYIGIYLIFQIAGSFATVPLTKFIDKISYSNPDSLLAFFGPMAITIAVIVLVTAGLYFVNEHIMKYRLNLE